MERGLLTGVKTRVEAATEPVIALQN
jgi:hypothetical protein